jgi:hypothetical protein
MLNHLSYKSANGGFGWVVPADLSKLNVRWNYQTVITHPNSTYCVTAIHLAKN